MSRSHLPSEPLPAALLYPGSRVQASRAHRENNLGHFSFVPATIVVTAAPADRAHCVLIAYDVPHYSGWGNVFAQVWLPPSRLYPFPDEHDLRSSAPTPPEGRSVYVPHRRGTAAADLES